MTPLMRLILSSPVATSKTPGHSHKKPFSAAKEGHGLRCTKIPRPGMRFRFQAIDRDDDREVTWDEPGTRRLNLWGLEETESGNGQGRNGLGRGNHSQPEIIVPEGMGDTP